MITKDFERIEKEKMISLKFPHKEVLKDAQDIAKRHSQLKHALAETEQKNTPLKIYFKDGTSRKMVETSIWGVTNKQVILERSVGIPISRIYSVK